MPSLREVFQVLNDIRDAGVVVDYAVGGATAVLFYAEPTRTYDLDVFVILPSTGHVLAPLAVPVQFLPVHNPLAEESVLSARVIDYEGVPVRVVDPEHLVALALQAGGARRRERAWQLFEAGQVDRERLRTVFARHQVDATVPDDV